MSQIILLDLNRVKLFGWESNKSDLTIDAIIRGIEAGDIFPPVFVRRISENEYELSPILIFEEFYDGGHNRAVGHYIANQPLKCRIINALPLPEDRKIEIRDIKIIDDSRCVEGERYINKMEYWPNYR